VGAVAVGEPAGALQTPGQTDEKAKDGAVVQLQWNGLAAQWVDRRTNAGWIAVLSGQIGQRMKRFAAFSN